MANRDKLRQLTVGAKKNFRKEIVKYDGEDFELRQPSVADRDELMEQCQGEDGKLRMTEFITWTLINNCYVPGTDERVFGKGDYEALKSQPTGGFVDELGNAAVRVMNVQEEEVKNSEDG